MSAPLTGSGQPDGAPVAEPKRRSIRWRLTIAFVLVAAVSVGLVATLAVAFGEHDLSTLASDQRSALTRSLVADAASTYDAGTRTWRPAELQPALRLARVNGATIAVVDSANRVVASSRPGLPHADDVERHAIPVRDKPVGTLFIRFSSGGLESSVRQLKVSLLVAVLLGAAAACVLALLIAALISRRLAQPLSRLVKAVRALGAGDRSARVGQIRAPDEIREVTENFDAMADQLVRQEQLRRELVADVAHELRTPVAVLQAECEAMLDGVTALDRAAIASLHEDVLRLARVVNDLQSLAAADAAALQLTMTRADLAAIAAAAADVVAARFAAANLTLQQRLTPAPVVADPDRMRQVVVNLLTNAAKFTPSGGRVELAVRREHDTAVLTVTDNGVGIDAASLPRVFDRFWRAPGAADVPGSGIGLAIVAGLVRAHHGTVSAHSEVGVGTTFTVRLPARET